MRHNLVTLIVIMILEDTAASQVLFLVSLLCASNITTVEINSGVHLLKISDDIYFCLISWISGSICQI